MKRVRKVFCVITIVVMFLLGVTISVSAAAPRFSSTSVNVKVKKSKKLKLKSLTKKQKKKKWSFASSDKSVVTVKRSSKTTCKIKAKKDGYAIIRAKQGKSIVYTLVKVGKGSLKPSSITKAWAKKAGIRIPGISKTVSKKKVSEKKDPSEGNETVIETTVLPTSVSLSALFVDAEEEGTTYLTASVNPANTTNKKLIWTSEDSSIASVDSNGKVTGISKGEVKITVKCGRVSDSCYVTVNFRKPEENRDYSISDSEIKFYAYNGKQYYNAIYEITNIGDKNLKLDSAVYDFYDSSGRLVASEDWISCDPDVIEPGETGYVWNNFKSTDLPIGSYRIKPTFKFERTDQEEHYYPISNLSVSKDDYSVVKIVGNITNDTSEKISYLYIVFLHYDSAGKVIGIHGTSITDVSPGVTHGFETEGMYLADYLSYDMIKGTRVIAAKAVY